MQIFLRGGVGENKPFKESRNIFFSFILMEFCYLILSFHFYKKKERGKYPVAPPPVYELGQDTIDP